jgi:hypothetical protein
MPEHWQRLKKSALPNCPGVKRTSQQDIRIGPVSGTLSTACLSKKVRAGRAAEGTGAMAAIT